MIRNLITAVISVISILATLTLWHVYTDHILLHAIQNAIIQSNQAQQKSQSQQ